MPSNIPIHFCHAEYAMLSDVIARSAADGILFQFRHADAWACGTASTSVSVSTGIEY